MHSFLKTSWCHLNVNHKANPDGTAIWTTREASRHPSLRAPLEMLRARQPSSCSINARNHRESQEGPSFNFKQIQISRPQASPSRLQKTPTVYHPPIFHAHETQDKDVLCDLPGLNLLTQPILLPMTSLKVALAVSSPLRMKHFDLD